MSAYRQPGRVNDRRSVIAEARRVRDALTKIPRLHNIGESLDSSQEIIDVLTGCLDEMKAVETATSTKPPLHSVVAVICDILVELTPDDQLRALEATRVSLGLRAPDDDNHIEVPF